MSANRSVQAAQRRRMGQEMSSTNNSRGPQPSIGSSHMFNGQQPRMPQQQQQQRIPGQTQKQQYVQQQQQSQQQPAPMPDVSKITVAQAITLITLRLGALESKMYEIEATGGIKSNQSLNSLGENTVTVDRDFMDTILERLNALETRPQQQVSSNGTLSQSINNDVTMLKQQFEPVKQAAVQTKNAVVSLTKESKDLKQNVTNLQQELIETKDLLNSLQTMVMDNNSKLLNLSLGGFEPDLQEFVSYDEGTTQLDELVSDDNEIVGTNLKELIENEINLDM